MLSNVAQPFPSSPRSSKSSGTSKRKFSPEEDERLTAIVRQFGDSNWKLIAARMGGWDCRQCRERWKNYLCPNVCKDPWTPEEDRLLEAKYDEFGSQWSLIARFFPSRTDVNIKNRWVVITAGKVTEKRVRRKRKKEAVLQDPGFPRGDDWGEGGGGMSRFCDDAELFDGDFGAMFGF
jgi:hypothetical protein